MPLYEYRCEKCGRVFEVLQKYSDEPLTTHEDCGGSVEKLISVAGLQFKGSGFYITDYSRGSAPASSGNAKTEGGSTKAEGSSSDSKSSESKSSDSKSTETKTSESKPATETKTESKPAAAAKTD